MVAEDVLLSYSVLRNLGLKPFRCVNGTLVKVEAAYPREFGIPAGEDGPEQLVLSDRTSWVHMRVMELAEGTDLSHIEAFRIDANKEPPFAFMFVPIVDFMSFLMDNGGVSEETMIRVSILTL